MPSPLETQLIETYLNTVNRCLWALPKQQRAEELRELRQHLAALTGPEPDADIRAALERFGPPQIVGRQIARTWWRGRLLSVSASPLGMTLLAGFLIQLPDALLRVLRPPEMISANTMIIHGVPWLLAIPWQMVIGLFVGRRMQKSPAVLVTVLMTASVLSVLLPYGQNQVKHLIDTGVLRLSSNELAVVRGYALAALYDLPAFALFLLPTAFAGRAWTKRISA